MKIKIIRKIDKLGRIVIPKDVRKTLNIELGDNVEISIDGGRIIIKKEPS